MPTLMQIHSNAVSDAIDETKVILLIRMYDEGLIGSRDDLLIPSKHRRANIRFWCMWAKVDDPDYWLDYHNIK